jgi:hypothetical protein
MPLGQCIAAEVRCNWYLRDINIYSLSKNEGEVLKAIVLLNECHREETPKKPNASIRHWVYTNVAERRLEDQITKGRCRHTDKSKPHRQRDHQESMSTIL